MDPENAEDWRRAEEFVKLHIAEKGVQRSVSRQA
jgi:hypothetical protein